MDADRIDVLDEAHGDHLVLRVADDFNLQLFPVEDGFLNKALAGERRIETAHAYRTELFDVVAETAAAAAHRIGGTHHDRISNLVLNEIHSLFNGVDDAGARGFDAELLHRGLEHLAILTALDGIKIHAYDLHAILIKDTLLG